MHGGRIFGSYLFSLVMLLLCLTVGAGVWSIWFDTNVSTTIPAGNSPPVSFNVWKGRVNLQDNSGSTYEEPVGANAPWGAIGRSRDVMMPRWWITIPLWELAILWSLWPVSRIARRVIGRHHNAAKTAPESVPYTSDGTTSRPRDGVWQMIRRMLLTGCVLLAVILGASAIHGVDSTVNFCTTNQRWPDLYTEHPITLQILAWYGTFDVEFRTGNAGGGMDGGYEEHWWGGFFDGSVPEGLFWLFGTPGWVPVAALLLWPCLAACLAIFRRLRNRRPGHCRQCGYNTFGLTNGICPECGTPLPAGSCPEQPANT